MRFRLVRMKSVALPDVLGMVHGAGTSVLGHAGRVQTSRGVPRRSLVIRKPDRLRSRHQMAATGHGLVGIHERVAPRRQAAGRSGRQRGEQRYGPPTVRRPFLTATLESGSVCGVDEDPPPERPVQAKAIAAGCGSLGSFTCPSNPINQKAKEADHSLLIRMRRRAMRACRVF